MERYKRFVRRNQALLSALETGASGLTWLVPDGDSSEVYLEAASSFLGIFQVGRGTPTTPAYPHDDTHTPESYA